MVVPYPQARRLDGQARPHTDLLQRPLGVLPTASFVDFGKGAGDGFGQQGEILLEHVVHGAGAHHVDRVLFAEDAGKEDEGGFRRQATGFLQGQAAGEAWQDEIGEDQIELAALQGLDNASVVVDQLAIQHIATALERHLRQLGVTRAVFDKQDADGLRGGHRGSCELRVIGQGLGHPLQSLWSSLRRVRFRRSEPGGGSLSTAQNTPRSEIAATKSLNSTGLTT